MTEDIRLTIYFNTQAEKEYCQNIIRNAKTEMQLKKTGDALYKIFNDYNVNKQNYYGI